MKICARIRRSPSHPLSMVTEMSCLAGLVAKCCRHTMLDPNNEASLATLMPRIPHATLFCTLPHGSWPSTASKILIVFTILYLGALTFAEPDAWCTVSSRSGTPSLASTGRDATRRFPQIPTPLSFITLGDGGVAKGVFSLQSSSLSRRLSGCMWATLIQNLVLLLAPPSKAQMLVLVLV